MSYFNQTSILYDASNLSAFGTIESSDLTNLDLFIAPGETTTFSIQAQASSTIGVSVNWSEDI